MEKETPDIFDSKLLKGFTKGSLIIIGLFAVLYCGVTTLVLLFDINSEVNIFMLILVSPLIIFLIIFFTFICLMKLYYNKLYESLSKKREESLLKKQIIKVVSEACLMVVKIINLDSGKDEETLKKLLNEMLELSSKINSGGHAE